MNDVQVHIHCRDQADGPPLWFGCVFSRRGNRLKADGVEPAVSLRRVVCDVSELLAGHASGTGEHELPEWSVVHDGDDVSAVILVRGSDWSEMVAHVVAAQAYANRTALSSRDDVRRLADEAYDAGISSDEMVGWYRIGLRSIRAVKCLRSCRITPDQARTVAGEIGAVRLGQVSTSSASDLFDLFNLAEDGIRRLVELAGASCP